MTYAEEMRRIRQNKLNNKDCYTTLRHESTLDKLRNLLGNLSGQRQEHEEMIRWNFDKLEDPGSSLEMWLYIIADVRELIKREEEK